MKAELRVVCEYGTRDDVCYWNLRMAEVSFEENGDVSGYMLAHAQGGNWSELLDRTKELDDVFQESLENKLETVYFNNDKGKFTSEKKYNKWAKKHLT